jgi:hypothetical protein
MKKENDFFPSKRKPFFGKELVVVNIGIRPFYDDLRKQNVKVAHVDWEPPPGAMKKSWHYWIKSCVNQSLSVSKLFRRAGLDPASRRS